MTLLWFRTWQIGLKSLLLHPLRSMLTVLGIFIGVASVIWLLAIGEGISQKAQDQIASLGANNIIVRTIKPPSDSANSGSVFSVAPYGITRDDWRRLRDTIPTVVNAIPVRELRYQFGYASRQADGRLVGCTPEYAEVTGLRVDRGHFLTDAECNAKLNHCVLAADIASELFPYEDPIGRAIHVKDKYYVVVGVLKPKAPSAGIGGSLAGQDYSHDVYIPIDTLWDRIGDRVVDRQSGSVTVEIVELSQVTLAVDSTENVMRTSDIVRMLLEKHHPTKDFGITVPLELLEQARTTRLMFMIFMGLIAAISLVVGGIGIMNIMLATVTERTREIGIRRALGAKRADITTQFLIETISLSFVGGCVGVLIGLTCGPVTSLLRFILEETIPTVMSQLPPTIQEVEPILVPWSIPLAFGISVTIGVVFGLYPAMRAAAMDPIQALRHE